MRCFLGVRSHSKNGNEKGDKYPFGDKRGLTFLYISNPRGSNYLRWKFGWNRSKDHAEILKVCVTAAYLPATYPQTEQINNSLTDRVGTTEYHPSRHSYWANNVALWMCVVPLSVTLSWVLGLRKYWFSLTTHVLQDGYFSLFHFQDILLHPHSVHSVIKVMKYIENAQMSPKLNDKYDLKNNCLEMDRGIGLT